MSTKVRSGPDQILEPVTHSRSSLGVAPLELRLNLKPLGFHEFPIGHYNAKQNHLEWSLESVFWTTVCCCEPVVRWIPMRRMSFRSIPCLEAEVTSDKQQGVQVLIKLPSSLVLESCFYSKFMLFTTPHTWFLPTEKSSNVHFHH